MGSPTFFVEQEIAVLNRDQLVAFIDTWRAGRHAYYCDVWKAETLDFEKWNEFKIQGYWYTEFREFLFGLAPNVQGFARFHYWNWDGTDREIDFKIVFRDGGVFFTQYLEDEDHWITEVAITMDDLWFVLVDEAL